MCTNKEDQVNSTTTVKNSDVNVTINKQQQRIHSDTHSVDFQIHTNIEFISNKKIKLCLLINMLISVACISVSFLIIYKMHTELLQVQNQIILLNQRLSSLNDICDNEINGAQKTDKSIQESDDQQAKIEMKSELSEYDYEFIISNNLTDTYLSRLRRANKRTRAKQTARRKVKSSGALAAHFKGSLPEININDQGLIGPWYPDHSVSRNYKFPKFHLTEGKCSIEVTEPALYFIYAQVYYVSSSPVNSYSIFVRSEGSSENNMIAKCSAAGPNNSLAAEISCYTAAIYSLKSNDRIFMQQTEKNRTVILRDGHSFFGLVRLNNSHRSKVP